MFTTIDKALTAFVMGLLSLLTLIFGWQLPGFLDTNTLTMVISTVVAPILVYFIPNKKT